MNGDGPTEDELHRRTEEHNKKVEALEKQRQVRNQHPYQKLITLFL